MESQAASGAEFYDRVVARAKRTADRRTAAAVAEDLGRAREAGGLAAAGERRLAATLDLLAVTGVTSDQALPRAHDLLLSYVRRGCQLHKEKHEGDLTAQAAAISLETLLSRPSTNTRKAQLIRQDAAESVRHAISADAVRKREDRIIGEIADAVFEDLEARLRDEPPSLEAAIHRLVPLVADMRQILHDGLMLTYKQSEPADPQERRLTDEFRRRTVLKAGKVTVACEQLFQAGVEKGQKSRDEFWFMGRASTLRNSLFREGDDRAFMRGFSSQDRCDIDEGCEHLLATGQGCEVFARWVAWTGSCYPTCAFERTWDTNEMCSPHAFITDAYGAEVRYVESGFSALAVPGNDPLLLHHRLSDP